MHDKKRQLQLYCAKILILLSFGCFTYGLILDVKSTHKLFDPVRDAPIVNDENTISITPVNGSEVVSEETNNNPVGDTIEPIYEEPKPNTNTNNNLPNNNNTNNNVITSGNGGNNFNVAPKPPTIEETNNLLRREIENTYGVTVKYGDETAGYTVGGISTTPISDPYKVTESLNNLKYSLSLYPSGLFSEIKNGGIPLTVVLVNNYSNNSVTGVTDSDYNYAIISIAVIYPFGESFYHESYHYIERYLFKKGANYYTWDLLNPAEFQYGNIRNDYSYSNTFAETAPFVNNYAQTASAEDRASTFEYMMASSKASCLNYGNTVWRKANLMSETMDLVLNSVTPEVTEYWERYLY